MTSVPREPARVIRAAVVAMLALAAPACRFDLSEAPRPDGGEDAASDGGVSCPSTPPPVLRARGEACACDIECRSGVCAQGFCCDGACDGRCRACNVPGHKGTCVFVPAGLPPADGSQCPAGAAATCGADGTCDGHGGCALYPAGALCEPGHCDGAAVVSAKVCDGKGKCSDPRVFVCAPFGCDAASTPPRCRSTCGADGECATGAACKSGSCGKKQNGAVCAVAAECESGFCADGVCCNVACSEACMSCAGVGFEGTCRPVPAGHPDPRKTCKEEAPSTCGRTGVCDGAGRCARYDVGTACAPGMCGGTQLLAKFCDASGACVASGTVDCFPYGCRDGACVAGCTGDGDCAPGRMCTAGSCGKRGLGGPCTMAADCESGFCVDGVCCESACTGACRSCGLPSALGHCTLVPAAAPDPHAICKDGGVATCGLDGLCDGAGACRRTPKGTVCAPERCAMAVYTPAATCDGNGTCDAAAGVPCSPFQCNGNVCFASCSKDTDCIPGYPCLAGSCGKKGNGAACSVGTQCSSGVCAQGVCCATACAGGCSSCALPGGLGTCTSLPAGTVAPGGACTDAGAASCAADGKCDGAGACEKYPAGTGCAAASCPAGMSGGTQASTCDGKGACVAGGAITCAPYLCDGGTGCKTTCSGAGDCAAPATCSGGSCGKKALGTACTGDVECASGHCTDGVCCSSGPCASCKACNVAGASGACANLPGGAADARCGSAPPCGNTGLCDGAGACRVAAPGTPCGSSSCTGATFTTAAMCNGAGSCTPGGPLSCGNYQCDSTAGICRTSCTSTSQCTAPNQCIGSACTLKGNGVGCAGDGECASGHCTDGVCCGVAMCGTCQTCAGSSPGTCTALGGGAMGSGCAGRCWAGACCTGCWNGSSCVAGTSDGACGGGGDMCVGCGTCQGCSGGACAALGGGASDMGCMGGLCWAGACCTGCWNGSSCVGGTSDAACGTGGAFCGTCGVCSNCVMNACAPLGGGATDGGCAGKCYGGACCTGCWDGATCRGGGTQAFCGSGGNACTGCGVCQNCSGGSCVARTGTCNACGTCSGGTCMPTGPCPTCKVCTGAGACTNASDGTDCGSSCSAGVGSPGTATNKVCTSGSCTTTTATCTDVTFCCPTRNVCDQICTAAGTCMNRVLYMCSGIGNLCDSATGDCTL